MKISLFQMNATVGAVARNTALIVAAARTAHAEGAQVLLTPELSITGYPPEDLLLRPAFLASVETALDDIKQLSERLTGLHIVVGHPHREHLFTQVRLFNAVSVFANGTLVAFYHKRELPNYAVFDEQRYFTAGAENQPHSVFDIEHEGKITRFGLNICEDVWFARAPAAAKSMGVDVLLVSNASPFHVGKQTEREAEVAKHVAAMGMTCVYVNAVGGQDELVFDGGSFVMNAASVAMQRSPRFAQNLMTVNLAEMTQAAPNKQKDGADSTEADIYAALVLGVQDYVRKNGFPSVLLGLSGGVDSALTLAIACDALGADKVRAVMMPTRYTAQMSLDDSREMVARCNTNVKSNGVEVGVQKSVRGKDVQYEEIDIEPMFQSFLGALAADFAGTTAGTAEENIQARVRGTLLMALSNKFGSIVLTTGNKSEMAVGYCTLYGDMAGGFAVIKDVAKTMVYKICAWRNSLSADEVAARGWAGAVNLIPENILTRAPSAELRENQKDQDSLPDYAILDDIIHRYMEQNQPVAEVIAAGHDAATVKRVVKLITINEYKRRQAPVGVRITPRGFGRDWRYPITNRFVE